MKAVATTRGQLERYLERLMATGREEWAAQLGALLLAPVGGGTAVSTD